MSKVILITGASSGIGAATARAAVERGHKGALIARSEDKLADLVAEFGEENALALTCDVTDPEAQKLCENAITSGNGAFFLQVDEEQEAPEQKACMVLQQMVAKCHSFCPASLAVSVRISKTGNLGKVIDAVEDMIAILKQQEPVDIDQHVCCTKPPSGGRPRRATTSTRSRRWRRRSRS